MEISFPVKPFKAGVRIGETAAVLVLSLLSAVGLPAAGADCPRQCEVWAYGYKEPAPGTYRKIRDYLILQTIAKDPSFNRGVFLEKFKGIFSGSRLQVDAKDRPEYSLTATFSKITELNTEKPYSCLTVTLGFNAGDRGSGYGSFYWITEDFSGDPDNPDFRKFRNDIPCHYHQQLLYTWLTVSPGHDIDAHVALMAAKVSPAKINAILDAYEQIPVSVEMKEKPYWCDPTREEQGDGIPITLAKIMAAAAPLPGADITHDIRLVITARKGRLIPGTQSSTDDKAMVYPIRARCLVGGCHWSFRYYPPPEEDKSDVITVYNSCEIRKDGAAPMADTQKKDKLIEIETECGWEGTLSKQETMKAGQGGSGLAALLPGSEYDLSKNWKIRFKLKRKSGREGGVTRYEVSEVRLLSFQDAMDATLTKMEREKRRIESRTRQTGEAEGRTLTSRECRLELTVDPGAGSYSLAGKIEVEGIPVKGRDEMEIKVKPVDKKVGEEPGGTTGIDEEIRAEGEFPVQRPPCVPEELKGSKDLMAEMAPEFREFMEVLGGKQSYILSWELTRQPVKVTVY